MSNEEALKKYYIKIKQDINEIVKEYKVTDTARIKLVTQRYKEGFITGFNKKALVIAKNLLKAGLAIDLITKVYWFVH